ncbi:ABC transporter ATP-binding protein [Demequina capsici]|uniref:ABC transporter ATP-binding protein n=1 Tax=Demequina capsici TaxID=3075620 RepID=A0AA96F528_9MICO|nr:MULTISPECIES: ABC transporter ATP-binding protein [unclassified Demequina]WNM23904.1 ABC transporter ATP-binding protein [Demequina sp. OYTSA14]WNM26743.1 ABC transporter ATP-binding protein [Demequina sp. PMTSA13]
MTTAAISLRQVSHRYGATTALEDLTLHIPQGEIFGLLGHNGAGKTTTVSILTTLLKATSGDASVAGHDVRDAPHEVRRAIGYLPENVAFYNDLTTVENLTFFARLSGIRHPETRIAEVLEFVGFTGHDRERVGTFSKGMRQRVGLAQALIHRPDVLFLDEPTSGLDPEGVKALRELILRVNADWGTTIFMNTHLLSEVTRTCTSIGILRSGRLVHHGSLADTVGTFPTEEALERAYFAAGSIPS